MVHAKPGGAGSVEETSRRDPILDQVGIAERSLGEMHRHDRALAWRFWGAGWRVARGSFGDGHILLALHQRGETRDILAFRRQPPGIVAGVAADVVRYNLDATFADRRGPEEIDGEPSEMGQAVAGGGAFDRPADQRRGRTGVLMVGIPRAAGEGACAKRAIRDFAVGCVQLRASAAAPLSPSSART